MANPWGANSPLQEIAVCRVIVMGNAASGGISESEDDENEFFEVCAGLMPGNTERVVSVHGLRSCACEHLKQCSPGKTFQNNLVLWFRTTTVAIVRHAHLLIGVSWKPNYSSHAKYPEKPLWQVTFILSAFGASIYYSLTEICMQYFCIVNLDCPSFCRNCRTPHILLVGEINSMWKLYV